MTGPANRPPPRPGEPDEAKVIAFPAACIKCGYDLRGLRLTGTCPECGTPVERSLHGDELADSPRGWLLSRRAASLAAAGHLWALGLLALVIGPLDGFLGAWYLRSHTGAGVFSPAGLICGGCAIVIVLGACRGERPGDVHADPTALWRRWAMLGLLALHLLTMLALFPFITLLGRAAPTVALVGVIFGVIAHVMLAVEHRHLAQRIPDAELATSFQVATMLFVIWIGAVLLFPRSCACCLAVPLGVAAMAGLSISYGRFGQSLHWIVHDIQPTREAEQAARAARREAARIALRPPSESGDDGEVASTAASLRDGPPPAADAHDPGADESQPLPPIDIEPRRSNEASDSPRPQADKPAPPTE